MKNRFAIAGLAALLVAIVFAGPGSAMNIGGYQTRAWRITGLTPGDPTPNFHYPFGIALNDSGDVYVADSMNDAILKFANDGTFVDQWGGHGSGDGEFDRPTGIAIGPSGDVFVTDTMNNRVQVFGPGGAYLDQWGTAGRNGGEFNHPIGIAISDADKVFVADSFNDRIEKFDLDGTFLTEFGESGNGGGGLNYPVGVATDHDSVFVTDNGNQLVQKFQKDGTFLDQWGGYNAPTGIAVDDFGNVYIVSSYDNYIQVVTAEDGEWVAGWGYGGTELAEFDTPTGIAVDEQANVYISDTNNKRIQVSEPCCALFLRTPWRPVVKGKTVKLRGWMYSTVPACEDGSQIDLRVRGTVVDSTTTNGEGAFHFSYKVTKRVRVQATFDGKPIVGGDCAPSESYENLIWVRR